MTLLVEVGGDRRPAPGGRHAESGGATVRWDESRWVDVCDAEDVLVLFDGVLHGSGDPPARLVADRYRRHGDRFAAGLAGDFVAVVLERVTGTVLVARDPVGVRPWYWTAGGSRLAGATSIAELVGLGWVGIDVDETTVVEYLGAVSRSVGPTLYRAVRTLAPGHTLVVANGRHRIEPHHRWSIEPRGDATWDTAIDECRRLIDLAVGERLTSPPTCELSGGLDSSTVVGTAMGLDAQGLAAARLVFDTPRADERSYSDEVVAHWGIEVVSEGPTLHSDEEAKELTSQLRRPLPDPQFTMFSGLHAELARRGRPLSLTGLGGDDAFITARIPQRLMSAMQLRQPGEVARIFTEHGFRGAWSRVVKPTLHHISGRGDRLPSWIRSEAAVRAGLDETFKSRPERVTGIAGIDARISNITSGYDAAILESRAIVLGLNDRRESHPFLDPRLIEATYGFDPAWPSRGGHLRALEVAAFSDRLPPGVRERATKAEFSEVFWPQLLDRATLERVRSGPLAQNGWLEPAGFDSLVEAALGDRPNVAIPLARCVSLDRWLRTL